MLVATSELLQEQIPANFLVHLLQIENLAALMISTDPLLFLSAASSAAAPARPVAVPACRRRSRHRPRRPRHGRGRGRLVL